VRIPSQFSEQHEAGTGEGVVALVIETEALV